MLDQIKIASPCTADWEKMAGDNCVRFCPECKKNVFNLSALSRRDAEALLKQTNGNLCARLYRRADGTVLTEDCPVGPRLKITRVRRRFGWAIAGALSLSPVWAQDAGVVSGSVRNADGSAAAKAPMLIKGDFARIETITDERGSFGAFELRPGKYLITVAGEVAQLEVRPGSGTEMIIQHSPPANMGVVAVLRRKPWWRRLI
jgi:hypothetical protein